MSVGLLIIGMAMPWLVIALMAALGSWIAFQLIHQNGRLFARLESLEQRLGSLAPAAAAVPAPPSQPAVGPPPGLAVGSPAPAFELPDLTGGRRALTDFRGRRLLVIFFNPSCGFCSRMAPEIAALPVDGAGGQPLPLVITTGNREANRKLVAEHGIRCPVLLQEAGTRGADGEVASRYQCHGTPMGYVVGEQGHIASELAVGAPALLALAAAPAAPPAHENGRDPLGGKRSLEESRIARDGLATGTAAPEFRLPLLHGGELSLADYRGRPVLLVFSDPNCGPCDQLAPRLEQLARRSPGIQVLMVSRGDPDANRTKAAEHGLTFPIVLQRQWEISREYAMFSTPVGYWIDEKGAIASDIAVGVEPILALLAEPLLPTNGKRPAMRREKTAGRRP
jgi:peroxiredoxin